MNKLFASEICNGVKLCWSDKQSPAAGVQGQYGSECSKIRKFWFIWFSYFAKKCVKFILLVFVHVNYILF